MHRKRILKKKQHFGIRHWNATNWSLLAMLIIPIILVIIFSYIPMYGFLIPFEKNYQPLRGFFKSGFAGLSNFKKLFASYDFDRLIINTLILNVYSLLLTPVPMILAIVLYHCPFKLIKKMLENACILPAMLSTVVVVAMLQKFLSTDGMLNDILGVFGIAPKNHLLNGPLFYTYYVLSGLWQSMGFGSLIYSAALSDRSPEQHKAAMLDGASLFQRIRFLDIPLLAPYFWLSVAFNIGSIFSNNVEKLLLMRNTINQLYSKTLSTFAYERVFDTSFPNYSLAAAAGMFSAILQIIAMFLVDCWRKKKEER